MPTGTELEFNALLLKSTIAGVLREYRVGGPTLGIADFSIHNISQRGRGGHGIADELVARTTSHIMVKTIKIWTGIRRQSGNRQRSGGAIVEQEGDADHGRHPHRPDSEFDDAAVGAMEHFHPTDFAFAGRADRSGFLRRLRQNHPTKQRWHAFVREALGARRAGDLHRALSLAGAFHQQTDHGNHGAVLQIPSCDRRGLHRAGASPCSPLWAVPTQ